MVSFPPLLRGCQDWPSLHCGQPSQLVLGFSSPGTSIKADAIVKATPTLYIQFSKCEIDTDHFLEVPLFGEGSNGNKRTLAMLRVPP